MADGPGLRQTLETSHDATLIGVALAGIVSVVVTENEWNLFDSMVGVVLLLVLVAYGKFRREVVATRWEAAAVGAVLAFCLILVIGPAIHQFSQRFGCPLRCQAGAPFRGFWFAVVWLVLTVPLSVALRVWGEQLVHPAYRGGRVARRANGE